VAVKYKAHPDQAYMTRESAKNSEHRKLVMRAFDDFKFKHKNLSEEYIESMKRALAL